VLQFISAAKDFLKLIAMASSLANQLSLAPLGAGDLIDRTVRLYRRNFWALIRASMPPVVVSATGALLWTISLRGIGLTGSSARLAIYFLLAAIGGLLLFVGSVMNFIVMGGATRNLVAHLLTGEEVSARAIYRSVRARFAGLLGAAVVLVFWLGVAGGITFFAWYLSVIAIFLVVAGFSLAGSSIIPSWAIGMLAVLLALATLIAALFLFFFLIGRIVYLPQVMMVEGRGVFDAIGRSLTLARGNTRRLLAMFLFTTFATYSAMMLFLIPLVWLGYLNGIEGASLVTALFGADPNAPVWYTIGQQVIGQCSRMLLAPVWMMGLSLLYVDERARHEGYDIELMAAQRLGEMPDLPDGRIAPLAPALANAANAAKTPHAVGETSLRITTLGLS
jgi:hypothetical protein